MGRQLAQARPRRRSSPLQRAVLPAVIVLSAVVVVASLGSLLAAPDPPARPGVGIGSPTPSGAHSPGRTRSTADTTEAAGSPRSPAATHTPPTATATAAVATATPRSVTASPPPTRTPRATASPTPRPSPSPTPPPGIAPSGSPPPGFSMREVTIDIAFPVRARDSYRYRNNFLAPRVGEPRPYNHVAPKGDGTLRRLHDGVDIYVRAGTPVLSPFDGIVVDPAWRWKPWYRQRYGLTAVVLSTEPGSRGFLALLAHLDRMDVAIGERVRRGQVLGTQGDTGNAEGQAVHLHFELRTPYLFPVRVAGKLRRVDAIDPYPSLVAADPKRRQRG